MARIDLIDVAKTLKDSERAGSGSNLPGAMSPEVSTLSSGARRSPFAIKNLNLTISVGETVVILGPSGCGKTTLLKIIAGPIPPDAGAVRYDDVDVKDVPPGERRIGMVFQSHALYPHLSSRTNVLSHFLFKKKTPEGREDSIKGIIKGKVSLPMLNTTILSIHVGEHEVHAQASVDENFLTGDQVWLSFKRYHTFDNASGLRRQSYPETL